MKKEYLRVPGGDITIGKVVGENEEGLTLFIPKSMTEGKFHLTEGDAFLSLVFIKTDGQGGMMPWCPWADGPVMNDA